MSRHFLIVFVAFCVLSQSIMALRGALFRSGRSLLHRQDLDKKEAHIQPYFVSSNKRSPIIGFNPVIDTGSIYTDTLRSYFRI